ncbi:MAG: HAD family hydrolase [Betaproteobacteria bacterium]|nr:HAD family hydrolase [Betaproteobacteria bacterium]
MTLRYEMLVFDWDGTLMDSPSAIVHCIQAACRDLGLETPDAATASHVIGLGLSDALAHVAPGLARTDYRHMVERYRHHFFSLDASIPLFPGTEAMLHQLSQRGHILAVATGKSRAGLERALESTGTKRHFAEWRCADQCAPKPAPDMLLELMEIFGVSRAATLMIGDTTHDLRMAANAGVSALAVSHGAHPLESLIQMGPLACLSNTTELGKWLMANG